MTQIHETLFQSIYQSTAGDLTIVYRGKTILICEFSDRNERIERQINRFYPNHALQDIPLDPSLTIVFDRYFDGETSILNTISTAPEGTPFEKKVWGELQQLDAGTTCSYGELANKLGSAPRAVGRANGRNPICLIHPCHRVIGADGSLTGYAGGLERKKWLLDHEGAEYNDPTI
ncbi:methylated-DNA--[protein]-cysteine S-methyltransferase [Kordiimonas sp. SCSIO 12610]|uniref:methylated-DNA--[protein]-cysteine S-methyltransferase n=1 Tax=Kordiimonas sp. SCSIO 12610 TaxID=2829597 RepID=UPI0021090C1B|nr:methylated-DNA--[protein]-cysteine S-methyltransferase [Kordiimonas sp. SCSIO 12610]UTW55029.1 methylated-DNA--[protein]-cysteine S-methyltransferase [Kordiimonas sp. SCSIO 12610]